jgi:RNA polymerase sigma-70 factor, ECF subfamily
VAAPEPITLTMPRSLDPSPAFHDAFVELFETHFPRLYRYLDRLSGEPELAADIAQETFIKLYQRGALPDAPEAWLISVAMNLFRNVKSSRSRRGRLLTASRSEGVLADPPPSPEQAAIADESGQRVRAAMNRLTDRDRSLLLLRAEGYSYRDIAAVLDLNEASIGTLLARARASFRACYEDPDAP